MRLNGIIYLYYLTTLLIPNINIIVTYLPILRGSNPN